MTSDLTAAGLDTSRLEERAIMLAKVKSAQGKRKRGETEDGMDVDMDGDGDEAPKLMGVEGEGDWMDVDGEQESAPRKRVKTNSGGVVAKREPRSNRQLAGFRDDAVRFFPTSIPPPLLLMYCLFLDV